MSMERLEDAVRVSRVLMDAAGMTAEQAASNPAIPPALQAAVLEVLRGEALIHLRDPLMLADPKRDHQEWLHEVDREAWYYWPRLRQYLIDKRAWSPDVMVRSVDRATDQILAAMENPLRATPFRTQGLVVGYVQSGKTANYSALLAKAVDCGYRLIIVLTGTTNSLRQQTQRRLARELVGLNDQGEPIGVGIPGADRQWFTFTTSNVNGDFNAGTLGPTALATRRPMLFVIKKWVSVLDSLVGWLGQAPRGLLADIPTIILDDEADQASVNTGGDRPEPDLDDGDAGTDTETAPSTTNRLVRTLLRRFERVAYLAYTATPFANVLIDPDAVDRVAGADLYPRSFIFDLPKPHGYYGAERIFGLEDAGEAQDAAVPGMDVLRRVPDEEVPLLVPARRADVDGFEPVITESLEEAINAFVLAGAARAERGYGDAPATMLIHTSYRTPIQHRLYEAIADRVERMRDQWRYNKELTLVPDLQALWTTDFRRVIRSEGGISLDVPFARVQGFVGPFLEQLQTRQINSGTLEELDYERDPDMKVIVVGGNKLSRGLTLEGLLVSYYVRPAKNYDTLMQMGRWFGFRDGYADLTRIYTTRQLESWFRDLATVELELRDDVRRYRDEGLSPLDFGVRIRKHPAMLVTSPLKMQRAQVTDVSFNNKIRQTINFPFEDRSWLEDNLETTRGLLSSLGPSETWRPGQPIWRDVTPDTILEFLACYLFDPSNTRVQGEPMRSYIRRQLEHDELTDWVVGVVGQARAVSRLGPSLDLGIACGVMINPIERTRLTGTNTLKAIASQDDQAFGMSEDQIHQARALGGPLGEALRTVRGPSQGALLIYPISRYSGHGRALDTEGEERDRVPIFGRPEDGSDVIGIAVIFPKSTSAASREYVVGRAGAGEE